MKGLKRFSQSRFQRKLLEITSTQIMPEIVARELAKWFNRVVVCHFSVDGKALVVVGSEGRGKLPLINQRLLLSESIFTQKVLGDGKPMTFYKSDVSTYGDDPWKEKLYRQDLFMWLEFPMVAENATLGFVFLDLGEDAKTIPDNLIEVSKKIISLYVKHYRFILELEESSNIKHVFQILHALDQQLSEELDRTFKDEIPLIDPILKTLANKVVDVTKATTCDICIERDGIYHPIAQSGILNNIGQSARIDDEISQYSITMRSLMEMAPVIRIEKRADPMFQVIKKTQTKKDRIILDKLKSWGAFPIVIGESNPGVISVASTDWDFFKPWLIFVLKLFAEKARTVLSVEHLVSYNLGKLQKQQKKMRELSLKLTELVRNISFSDAAHTVIHNIANILQPLEMNLGKLSDWARSQKGKFPSGSLQNLNNIIEQAEETLSYYHRFKQGTEQKGYFNINELLKEAVEFSQHKARQFSIQIDLRSTASNAKVLCSDVEIIQAFLNLIRNAMEAMQGFSHRGRRLVIRCSYSKNKVTIKFVDNGIGIKTTDFNKIWEADFSTKLGSGGTGLGLPFVKRTIEENCMGEIIIESKFKKGTTVTIILPAKK